MCKCCEKLIKCPVGEKRRVLLAGTYDHNSVIEIVLDRYPDKEEIFIHASFVDCTDYWTNLVQEIKYCPMCGQDLTVRKD